MPSVAVGWCGHGAAAGPFSRWPWRRVRAARVGGLSSPVRTPRKGDVRGSSSCYKCAPSRAISSASGSWVTSIRHQESSLRCRVALERAASTIGHALNASSHGIVRRSASPTRQISGMHQRSANCWTACDSPTTREIDCRAPSGIHVRFRHQTFLAKRHRR